MTDQSGPWRPAPLKPSSATEIPRVASAGPTTRPSAAIRGAAQAFLSRPPIEVAKTNTGSSNSARAAALGARHIARPATAPRPDNGNFSDATSVRGRQPGTPAANLGISASRIAAKLASASPSPVRSGSQSPGPRVSPRRGNNNKSPGWNTALGLKSTLGDLPEFRQGLPDGLPISAPRPIRPIPLASNNPPVLDMENAPILTRNVSSNSSQTSLAKSPHALAQAAARHATPVASPFELQERSSYVSRDTAPRKSSSSTLRDLDLGSPLEPIEPRSTTGEEVRKPVSSFDEASSADPSNPNSAPVPIRNTARKAPPKPAPGSGQIKDFRTGMTETALADAIVSSSLALSRASSPSKRDRPPAPPPRSRSHSLLHRHHHSPTSEPAPRVTPMKPMKQTLRKQPKQDNDDDTYSVVKRGRRHFVRKHPNKHHEGDRKRWRDKVTERERKRYEGVWAANRGLFTFWEPNESGFGQATKSTGNDDLVVNVVVRDIWERSRLPKDVLEEIWGLVAQPDAKALGRWEFVVGMWLIDQRLKGRKLPTRVSQSVWASVRNNIGLKVSSKPLS